MGGIGQGITQFFGASCWVYLRCYIQKKYRGKVRIVCKDDDLVDPKHEIKFGPSSCDTICTTWGPGTPCKLGLFNMVKNPFKRSPAPQVMQIVSQEEGTNGVMVILRANSPQGQAKRVAIQNRLKRLRAPTNLTGLNWQISYAIEIWVFWFCDFENTKPISTKILIPQNHNFE